MWQCILAGFSKEFGKKMEMNGDWQAERMQLKSSVVWAFVAPDWISLVCRHYRSDLLRSSVILGLLARNCWTGDENSKENKSLLGYDDFCNGCTVMSHWQCIVVRCSLHKTCLHTRLLAYRRYHINVFDQGSQASLCLQHLQHHTYNKQICHVITSLTSHLQ